MKTTLHPSLRVRNGFTLLEILTALGALLLLMGGIFAIANGTMELSSDMTAIQERSQVRQNFISFLRRSFRTLPGDAELRLTVQPSGGTYVPTLNFINGGTSFTPGMPLPPDTSVDLFAEKRPGGYLRVGLRLLDQKQTQSLRNNQTVRYTRNQAFIPLLDNVSRFEWRYYDSATNRWENNWKQARRPLLAEMNLRLDDGFETRAVFWIPPVIPNSVSGGLLPGGVTPPPGMNPDDPNAPIPDEPDVPDLPDPEF